MQARTASVEFLHASRNHSRTQIRPNIPDAKACRAAGRNSFTPTFVWHTLPSPCCLKTENGIWRDFLILEPQAHWPTFSFFGTYFFAFESGLVCRTMQPFEFLISISFTGNSLLFKQWKVGRQTYDTGWPYTLRSRTRSRWWRSTGVRFGEGPPKTKTEGGLVKTHLFARVWSAISRNKRFRLVINSKFLFSFHKHWLPLGLLPWFLATSTYQTVMKEAFIKKMCAWARVCRQCVFMCCFRFLRCLVVVRRQWLHIFSSISFNIST